jgi:poly(3-hydroxybutyrate) depolymerase
MRLMRRVLTLLGAGVLIAVLSPAPRVGGNAGSAAEARPKRAPEAGAGVDGARRFEFEGRNRNYFLFAPAESCGPAAAPAPLVLLHHGTGDSGRGLLAQWKELARRRRFIVAAPTGTGPYGWIAPRDGPELQRAVVERVRGECAVDPRRIYAVGFSNGGDFAFYVALVESRYFAGAAILCASLRPRQFAMLDLVERKIPIFYMVAERDRNYPLREATETRAALEARRWPFRYRLLAGRPHQYDPAFTTEAWDFLRGLQLDEGPRFTPLTDDWLRFALR